MTAARQRFWLTGAAYAVITLAFSYPFSLHPAARILSLDSDSLLVQWILAWDIHAFTHQPFHIFDANIFAPLKGTLAFAENLIGSALLAAPVFWLTGNLALALNLVSLVSIPLSGLGAYLLARRLSIGEAGAVLAGIVFAFSPPRFLRIEQFQLTTIQWMPFCLAYLHTYLDGGRRRDARIALAFFSLQAITAGHGAAFLTFAIITLLLYRFLLGEPLRIVDRIRDVGVTGALLLLPTVLVFLPYQGAREHQGLVRNLDGWGTAASSFFASPSHVDIAILKLFPAWVREQPDAYLFPGWVPLLLIAAACLWPRQHSASESRAHVFATRAALACEWTIVIYAGVAAWAAVSDSDRLKIGAQTIMTVRHASRLWMIAIAAAAVRGALVRAVPFAFGTRLSAFAVRTRAQRTNAALYYTLLTLFCVWLLFGPPYGIWPVVYKWPVLNFIRVPTRFVLLALLGLAVLTGMAFDRISARFSANARRAFATLACTLALIEFAAMPLEGLPYNVTIPKIDQWLAAQPPPFVVAEWPMPNPDNIDAANTRNARFMLHTMAHWQKTVHGFSGLLPKQHEALYASLYTFPDANSLKQLSDFGVTVIVMHDDFTTDRQRAETDAMMAPAADQLTLLHEEADGRVYAFRPRHP